MEEYGYPPKFPDDKQNETSQPVKVLDIDHTNVCIICMYVQLKSKVAAKEEKAYYQWEIMKMLNIEDEEIKKYINFIWFVS